MRIVTPHWLLAALLAAACGALPFAARAGGPGHEPPPLDTILEHNAERLGLDADTLARVREIVAASRPEHDRLADEVHALRLEMRTLLSADAPDQEKAMKLADQIGAAETALDKHRLATLLQIRTLLTPEQRRELVRIHEEHRRARFEARARGEAPPPPP